MIYQLSYELKTQEHDYTSLFNYLEHEIGVEAKHVLRDTWWISTNEAFDVTRKSEEIRSRMGEKDILFFCKLSDSEIDGWLPPSIWKWYTERK